MVSLCPVDPNKVPDGSGCKLSSSNPAARASCPAEIVGEPDVLLASVKPESVLAGEPWALGGDFGTFLVRNGGMASGVAYAAYRSEVDACAEAREEAREIGGVKTGGLEASSLLCLCKDTKKSGSCEKTN